jgi:hypothetical protein
MLVKEPTAKESIVTINNHPLKLTNLSKIYFPEERSPKGMYWPIMMPLQIRYCLI